MPINPPAPPPTKKQVVKAAVKDNEEQIWIAAMGASLVILAFILVDVHFAALGAVAWATCMIVENLAKPKRGR